jgi:S-adenosylmethionine hydrolase
MATCTLLTDFGTRDWYVGALKGTLLRLAPGVVLVDVTHDIDAGDVTAASFVLGGAALTFPPGTVHLAVVDPGVGSSRRLLAVEVRPMGVSGGAGSAHVFVAPDNGLLTPVLDGSLVHAVDRPDLYLDAPGHTFHGRDRFAPVAAALLRGTALDELGPRIVDPVRLPARPPHRDEARGRLEGHVVHVDRYGNLVTDLPGSWLRGRLSSARAGTVEIARIATHYAALEAGVPALVIGSLGTIEIAVRDGSAALLTGIRRGDPVTVELSP